MLDYVQSLTSTQRKLFEFLKQQIELAEGQEFFYKLRDLKQEVGMGFESLKKALEKFHKDKVFHVEKLDGYHAGYRAAFGHVFLRGREKEEAQASVQQQQTTRVYDVDLLGREDEVQTIQDCIKRKKHVLLYGDIGVGKTAILQHVYNLIDQKQGSRVLYAEYGKSLKELLINLAFQMHEKYKDLVAYELTDHGIDLNEADWKSIRKKIKRMTISDLCNVLLNSVKGRGYVVIFDHIEAISPTGKAFLESLFQRACVLAGSSYRSRNRHFKKMWWDFKTLEVSNLASAPANELIEKLIGRNTAKIYEPKMFKSKVLKVSGGNPRAISKMVEHASVEKYVDNKYVRSLENKGKRKEFDLTLIIMFLLPCVVAMRFVALGMNDRELYIIAGVSAAFILPFRYSIHKMLKGDDDLD